MKLLRYYEANVNALLLRHGHGDLYCTTHEAPLCLFPDGTLKATATFSTDGSVLAKVKDTVMDVNI